MSIERKGFDFGHFLLGLLLLITGIIAFRNPLNSLVAIVAVFAVSAIIEGIIQLVFRRRLREYAGHKSTSLIVLGVLDILIGVFLLFNMSAGLVALPYIFAIWFIVDSIGELIIADAFKTVNNSYYWFKIVLNVLGIILGFMLLFNPITSALTLAFLVGFYFVISGIDFIVTSF